MSKKDSCAHQTHYRCHCFDHRKTSFCAPREPNDVHPRTVKKIPRCPIRSVGEEEYEQQVCPARTSGNTENEHDHADALGNRMQSPSRKLRLTTSRPSPFPPLSGCVIFAGGGMRLGHVSSTGTRPGEW